ncbi:MAG: hypothetical protein DYG93_09270 [Leptolyngbya sp. PLA2]|nr:hypothetical protein [Leptolyngbya sp.]MCE7971837.1 hypothetical protein [Leptolyngbya sp. PL-A2]MCZ7634478.1 hypothetical protein [Phycisphaerales bacterium]MDL1904724.1 hypothetical protein [Synechococcales cyanobacterium CNB]GIK19794.1 MAG: hypothetical protein BroJett004_19580 [Planctomycetota bacterium]
MTTPRLPSLLVALVSAVAASAQAVGQNETPLGGKDSWTVRFEPAVWFVGASGDLRLPGTEASGNGQKLDFGDLNLDSPRASPFGELHLKRGPWRISFSALALSSGGRDFAADGPGQLGPIAFDAGDVLDLSMDYVTFDTTGGYEFLTAERGTTENGGVQLRSRLIGFAGARFHDVDFDASLQAPDGVSVSADRLFAEPIVGLRWELDINERFTIDVVGAGGAFGWGDQSSWSADIGVGFTWRPVENLGVQVGYRQLVVGLEDGDAPERFEWRGSVAGLYAGAVLRF